MNIRAQMAAIELSRDANWLRYRFSAFFASGDDRSIRHGQGFDTITDNPNLAGGQFMYWTQQNRGNAGRWPQTFPRSSACCRICALSSAIAPISSIPGSDARNGGLDMRLSPALKLVTNARLLRFANATILRSLAGAGPGFEDDAIGIDVGVRREVPAAGEREHVHRARLLDAVPLGGFKSAIGSTAAASTRLSARADGLLRT